MSEMPSALEEDTCMENEDPFMEEYDWDEDVTQEELDNVEVYLESHSGNISALEIYRNQIRNIPIMTQEEELECAKRVQNGDMDARDKMIESNLRFVIAKALRYKNNPVEIVDLIQEGNVALVRAVDRYDYRMGTRFTTYAGYWVHNALDLAVSNISRTASVPRKTVSKFKISVKKVYDKNPNLQEYATAEMIAKEMGSNVENVKSILQAIQEPYQLDASIKEEDDLRYCEIIHDDCAKDPVEGLYTSDIKKVMDECLAMLTRKERIVLKLVYGYTDGVEHTTDEVGKEYNVTRERIRQIIDRAYRKLEKKIPKHVKTDYVQADGIKPGDKNGKITFY